MKKDKFESISLTGLKNCLRRAMLLFALLPLAFAASAQQADSTKTIHHFVGSVSVTNNGISIVPSFSLGKPAVIFNASMGKKRFSFDPDLRFSLAGKPWSFLFWGRYKLVDNNRFRMNAGTHLGLNHKTSVLPVNRDTSETTVVRRYLAAELYPRYLITTSISVGIYYLYSHGLDAGIINNTHFVTLNAHFSRIKLSKQLIVKINPQFYYLKLDAEDGFYFTTSITLEKQNFPISISAIINKEIDSHITGSKDLLWNASLVYTFGKKFVAI